MFLFESSDIDDIGDGDIRQSARWPAFARCFRYVSGRLHAYAHHVYAEQPPMSNADGLISFNIETPIINVYCLY